MPETARLQARWQEAGCLHLAFRGGVITGLVDNIWSGREVRARGHRAAPRTA
jgi:hypothetical protein